MSVNTLLISALVLKDRSSIHGNIDEKLLYNDIKYAQDAYILPVCGTALFVKLQTLVSSGDIDLGPNADYKTLMDLYVIDALVYFTLSKLPMSLGLQFWNKGVVRKLGDNTELPSMTELVDLSNEYLNRAQHYANRMRLFLITQSSQTPQKYPEYTLPGSTIDTVTPERHDFTSPIWLGTNSLRDDPWCNPGGFNGQPYHD